MSGQILNSQSVMRAELKITTLQSCQYTVNCRATIADRRPDAKLFLIDEMGTAVLLPALFRVLVAERFFFTIADRFDTVGGNAGLRQSTLHCFGTAGAQCQVVLCGSAFVAVSLNRNPDTRVLAEKLSISLQRRLLIGTNIGFVIVEVDVLDRLGEQLLFRRRRASSLRWGRWAHRHAGGRLLSSTGAFSGQMISRRIRRRHLL